MQKTKFSSNKQYLFGLLFSRNAKKAHTVYYKLFYSVRIGTSPKPLKKAAAKKSFSGMHIIDVTCFDEYFSFHLITGNIIFHTDLLPRGLVQPPCCCVL